MRIIAAVDHTHPYADKEISNWLFRSTEILKQAWFMHPDDLKTIKTVLAENPAIVFAFRNSLIHRYWTIDDDKLIENIKSGSSDFYRFAGEIEAYLADIRK